MKVRAYKLRSQGKKVTDQAAIRATEVVGWLTVRRTGAGTEAVATLLDDAGQQLLHEIRSPTVEISAKGILVSGTNDFQKTDGVKQVRQAWWCAPVE